MPRAEPSGTPTATPTVTVEFTRDELQALAAIVVVKAHETAMNAACTEGKRKKVALMEWVTVLAGVVQKLEGALARAKKASRQPRPLRKVGVSGARPRRMAPGRGR